ncbi:aminotransferase class I/II-fold pyridoxal phosphate-dependent enzyme [Spirulina subsalsa]|uniref:aminotransferase class I/II-fold pyridoxal phosphate-dependent enzyme n=1 Tax=Spirulina subsalsa TaxID=54311 RepID=UPI0002D69CFC|nr:aminotransferase class I/II-fold pyridoxal phosphate-dependent enzyme [Spirulina subsalsa]
MDFPLIRQLKHLGQHPHAPFYAPGHKLGRGMGAPWREWLGEEVGRADFPELPEVGNLFGTTGAIAKTQHLAAQTFGAQETFFLVNGSTGGILAAILATCGEGERLLLPRNVHQSALHGLILSGAMPVFIQPEYDPGRDVAYGVTPEAVEGALGEYSDIKAVLVVYPTYQGIGGDLEAIANITHHYGVPLLVDEAHGAHFAFHPDLPPSALSLGADLTVQSTHKVLGALSQASMVHVQGPRLDRARLNHALRLVQSTSPNSLLLASLESATYQMATEGEALLTETLALAAQAEAAIATLPSLNRVDWPTVPRPGYQWRDRTRLTVFLQHLALTGFEADEILQQLGVIPELPLEKSLTFILTFGNTPQDIEALISGLEYLSATFPPQDPSPPLILPSPLPPPRLTPREAFFRPKIALPIAQTIGRICGESICCYPPGIPLLMPGEEITATALAALEQVLHLGGEIIGLQDANFETLLVVNC